VKNSLCSFFTHIAFRVRYLLQRNQLRIVSGIRYARPAIPPLEHGQSSGLDITVFFIFASLIALSVIYIIMSFCS